MERNLDDLDIIISQIDTTSSYYLGQSSNNEPDDMDEVMSQIDIHELVKQADTNRADQWSDSDDGSHENYNSMYQHSNDESVDYLVEELDDMDDAMSPIVTEDQTTENETNNVSHENNSIDNTDNATGENDGPGIPLEMMGQYQAAVDKILPNKSADRYMQAYNVFRQWQASNGIVSLKEDVMMCYFSAAAQKYKPSTIWSMYSMIKKTLIAKHNVDISKYCLLAAFLKTNGDGYESKKSEVFEPEEIQKFMMEAPNIEYLGMKVQNKFFIT